MDDARRCHARSKQSGERCKRPAAPGKRVCYMHGANAGPPKGNLNAMTHGIFAERILDEEERGTFDAIVARIRRDFAINDSSDTIALEALALACLRLSRAIKADDASASETWDRMVRAHLKDLKATKITREGEAPGLATTPAEWATALLGEIDSVRRIKKRAKTGEEKSSDAERTRKEPQI